VITHRCLSSHRRTRPLLSKQNPTAIFALKTFRFELDKLRDWIVFIEREFMTQVADKLSSLGLRRTNQSPQSNTSSQHLLILHSSN
jgi:hypothetical protein